MVVVLAGTTGEKPEKLPKNNEDEGLVNNHGSSSFDQ
jgi:hypothetical protein